MVGVILDRSTPESFAAFEKATAQLPSILDCHLVANDPAPMSAVGRKAGMIR